MNELEWPIKIGLSFILGGVIGLEREINERRNLKADKTTAKSAILGLRSFALIGGLGALSSLIISANMVLGGLLCFGFIGLLLTFYYLDTKQSGDPGITTEIAVIYSYIIGVLIATNLIPVQLTVAITVVLVLLMSRKEKIKDLISGINRYEINAFVSFAILSLVVLPFLPNQTFALSDMGNIGPLLSNLGLNNNQILDLELFNPFKLWFIVVLITGVDLLGYLLERTIGQKRGWLVTSLVGGFVSSTATTISIAQESKKAKNINPLLAAAILANLVSFIPIGLLLISLNPVLFTNFLPILGVLILVALSIGIYFLKQENIQKKTKIAATTVGADHKIFDLVAALKFTGIYLVINLVSKIAIEFLGTGGFFATTGIGALTGVDAVVINTAQLVGSRIDIITGVWALLLANTVNLLAKSVYSFVQGSRAFAIRFFISMLVIIIASLIAGGFRALI